MLAFFVQFSGLTLIDLALLSNQTALWSSACERAWRYLFFHFLEVESVKDAVGAYGKDVAVDRGKNSQNGHDAEPIDYWAEQQL